MGASTGPGRATTWSRCPRTPSTSARGRTRVGRRDLKPLLPPRQGSSTTSVEWGDTVSSENRRLRSQSKLEPADFLHQQSKPNMSTTIFIHRNLCIYFD